MTQSSTSSASQGSSPLQTDRGSTIIQDAVVQQIAGIAAQEVEGVQMGGGTSAAVGGFLQSVTGAVTGSSSGNTNFTQGVNVEVGQEEAAIDLTMALEYGRSIPQVTEAVRRNVANRVENLVGLRVTEVNIAVNNVFFPQIEEEQERQRQQEQQRREQEAQEQQRVQ